jgi:hypothetical protein
LRIDEKKKTRGGRTILRVATTTTRDDVGRDKKESEKIGGVLPIDSWSAAASAGWKVCIFVRG